MPAVTPFLPLIATGVGAAGSILGGLFGAGAAGDAADAQAQAVAYAAALESMGLDKNLAMQVAMLQLEEQNQAPWSSTGAGALSKLGGLLGITPQATSTIQLKAAPAGASDSLTFEQFKASLPADFIQQLKDKYGFTGDVAKSDQLLHDLYDAGVAEATQAGQKFYGVDIVPGDTFGVEQGGDFGSLLKPFGGEFTFNKDTFQADPGYQFRLQEGMKALQGSAAAKGGALSGGTMKRLADYSSGMASQEYNNAYNRAASDYDRAFNTYQTDQGNIFNRLAALSGTGQTAVNQINSAAGNFGANAGNAIMGSYGNQADLATQAGNATASGYIGGANAINGAISGGLKTFSQFLPYLFKQK